jgi:hypothetical protein
MNIIARLAMCAMALSIPAVICLQVAATIAPHVLPQIALDLAQMISL